MIIVPGKLWRILFILLGTFVANFFLRRLSGQLFGKIPSKRAKTLISVAQTTATTLTCGLTFLILLSELGVNTAPFLTSAGIVGFAVSFGAQSLIKDLIAGVFLLWEDTIREGETIEVVGIRGKVKKIGIRTLLLEDEKGTLHTIPNGTIRTVSNFSRSSKN